MSNPLLEEFKGSFNTPPFSQIKDEHFLPAFEIALKEAREDIAEIKKVDSPTFENVIKALVFSGEKLSRVSSVFFNLTYSHTNDQKQEIMKEISPKLTEFQNDILLDQELFNKVKAVWDNKNTFNLSSEEEMVLEKEYKSFTRNGALLNDKDKETLREIDKEFSKLSIDFGENVLKETNSYELHITNEADLEGLPEGAIEAAAHEAKGRDKTGWVFTLQMPSYFPLLKYAKNAEIRKEIFIASAKVANNDNEFDNKEIVKTLANLRHKRAVLLGYNSHSDYVLENRMAQTTNKVLDFQKDLLDKSKPHALKEHGELEKFAKETDGLNELMPWDRYYYMEKYKQKVLDFDSEEVRPFLKLENCIDGMFQVANKLYGLKFKERNDIDKYHEDVKTYEVTNETGELVGVFYADFFPRESKRAGAWCSDLRAQFVKDGTDHRPHVTIVCNFTKPTDKKPSLLNMMELTTLFHEFGHALHNLLSKCNYPNVSGTSVLWDFVELPSQILENWCYEKECLDLFARHYESGALIPQNLIDKIKKSSSFLEGLATIRQLSFGILDMAWHKADPSNINSINDFEKEVLKETKIGKSYEDANISCKFSHIFRGGYSAGYYSYKWAEVLDADAFEYFKENGIFNKSIAKKFKENILEKGGSEAPMDLYIKFRGKEPSVDALLRRAGLS